MNHVDEALDNLLDALNHEPVVVAFKKARELILHDDFILNTEKTLKSLQQMMTRHVMDSDAHQAAMKEYLMLKQKYDDHPYVLNYNSLLNDVNDLLLTINTIIQ